MFDEVCDGWVEWVDVWNFISRCVYKIWGFGVLWFGYYRIYWMLVECCVDEIYGGYKYNCGESNYCKF